MNNDYNNQQQSEQIQQNEGGNSEQAENNVQQYSYYQNEPGNSYGQPSYNPPQQSPQPGKGLATASMVCGIFSLVLFYTGFFSIIGAVLGIAAIITAVCAKKRGFIGGMATAGLVMGIIGTVLSIIVFVSCVACVGMLTQPDVQTFIEEWGDDIANEIYDYNWHY